MNGKSFLLNIYLRWKSSFKALLVQSSADIPIPGLAGTLSPSLQQLRSSLWWVGKSHWLVPSSSSWDAVLAQARHDRPDEGRARITPGLRAVAAVLHLMRLASGYF